MDEIRQKRAEPLEDSFEEDTRLAALAASGEPSAQRTLVNRLLPHVRRLMSYMTSDPYLVDDLTQSALVRILLRSESYIGNGPLESWATRVSTRTALNELKKLSRQRRIPPELKEAKSPFPMGQDESDRFLIKQKLSQLISKQKEKYRIPLVLKHIEGYSVKEISSIMKIPENTVRGRLRLARALLKTALEREPKFAMQVLGRKTR